MLRLLSLLGAVVLLTHCAGAPKSLDVDSDEPLNGAVRKPVKKEPGKSEILLEGRIYKVRWGDGDTFRLKTLTGKKKSARLAGFNTLESYGPVHRWGEWTADELYQLANAAGVVAAAQGWTCSKQPGGGGYGRLLVACPELERVLLEKGLAHIFSIDGPGDPELLALQRKAQEERVGMWEKGVPQGVVTSLHSANERSDRKQAYDRVVSASTGEAPTIKHTENYEVCQEVCHQGSCMLYVPYRLRYGAKKASCLR